MSSFATWLRAQPSLAGVAPAFDLASLPADPADLFRDWIRAAADAGVPEPHAATLATVDAAGLPDARTLILKDVGPSGWAFASLRSSAKAEQLAARPVAAMTFWWQPVVRAVRVRGTVRGASRAESAADFAARSPAARAGIDVDDWVLWRLVADHVEFWQGSPDRRHTRVQYQRAGVQWRHTS